MADFLRGYSLTDVRREVSVNFSLKRLPSLSYVVRERPPSWRVDITLGRQ
jgi:hypothetical protein